MVLLVANSWCHFCGAPSGRGAICKAGAALKVYHKAVLVLSLLPLLAGATISALNAISDRKAIRAFWSFLAASFDRRCVNGIGSEPGREGRLQRLIWFFMRLASRYGVGA